MPLIDKSNSSGVLEFSSPGGADSFYPVNVSFNMNNPFCQFKVNVVGSLWNVVVTGHKVLY